jgi:hypothetical protein
LLVALPAASPEQTPTYSVQQATFSSLTGLKNLDGKFFRLTFGGELAIGDIIGSQVTQPKFTGGSKPLLRYDIDAGVVVPRDYTSLALLSAYYQYEQVYDKLESLTGLSADALLSENGKLNVLFEPSITFGSGLLNQKEIPKLNAAYIPGEKQFVLFRRSAVEQAPIGLNLQVIAHEFGHALFELSFFENKFDECDVAQQQFIIRGFNEGFADVVSWAVMGSADVLRNSIAIDEIASPRNFSRVGFDYRDLKAASDSGLQDEAVCKGQIYCIGTLFAASVLDAHRAMGRSNELADRHRTMREVYAALGSTRSAINTTDVSGALNDAKRLLASKRCGFNSSGLLEDRDQNDDVSGLFLRGFVASAAEEMRTPLCNAFAARFGSLGFSEDARSGVCR